MALSDSKKQRLKKYYARRGKRYRDWILQSLAFVVIIQSIYLLTEWQYYTEEAELADILRRVFISIAVGLSVFGYQMRSNERLIKKYKSEFE